MTSLTLLPLSPSEERGSVLFEDETNCALELVWMWRQRENCLNLRGITILTFSQSVLTFNWVVAYSLFTKSKWQDRRYTYKCNVEAPSRNHSCRGEAINITYIEYVFVTLVIPACKAHAPYYVVICGVSDCTTFFPHCLISWKCVQ